MAENKNIDPNVEENKEQTPDVNIPEPETLTLTQAELDEKIKAAKAQVKKKLPPKDEYDAFLKWKEEQKQDDPIDPVALEAQQKYEEAQRELELYKNREKVMLKGVDTKFLDFVTYEATKNVDDETDFDTALETYLKANPHFAQAEKQSPSATGMRHGGTPSKMSGVERAFYEKNPQLRPQE